MSGQNLSTNSQPKSMMPHELLHSRLAVEPQFSAQSTPRRSNPARVAIIGNHLPRQCGIATFTTDLCDAISAEYSATGLSVAAVNDPQAVYSYPSRVRFQIAEGSLSSYRATADMLNRSKVDLVCLQHEFGIFGGKAGSHVLELLQHLAMPVVTTLHTVLLRPDPDQRSVMQAIAACSDRLVVMSDYSLRVLQEVFGVPAAKIDLIPHGIPDLPFSEPDASKDAIGLAGKQVLLTFGLLSPNKGFENVIRAMPRILERHKDAIYLIAGATHPHVKAREGDRYRIELQALARDFGVEREVVFLNRFFSPGEMASLVGAADIYITPYCHEAQAVSGTLAYAMGAGKAIISTPYWHAAELLKNERGALVPFENPDAIAVTAIQLLGDDAERHLMRERAYFYARKMVWSQVAHSYMRSFSRAHVQRVQPVRLAPAQAVDKIALGQLLNV